MELLEKIFLHTKQTISDEELQQIFQESDYELFHNEVERIVKSGFLCAGEILENKWTLAASF